MENTLYYGDNLQILRNYIEDESVDLIYLDPPFNSKASYNILFKEPEGTLSEAQITAFEDSWHWTLESEKTFYEIVEKAQPKVVEMIKSFRQFLGHNDIMAYLTMMCIRLLELKRVLKSTGSIYLHCDPTASHCLKILMDCIFGNNNYRNEIVWCYEIGGRISRKSYGRRHDVILFYTKNENYTFNWKKILNKWTESGIEKFRYEDDQGKYRLMGRYIKGSPIKGHRDVSPEWEKSHPELVYRHYLKEGKMQVDFWVISPINQISKERLGYPTQKPEVLLERIIMASSNKGDVILDPFCGCGTTIAVAHKLKRKWIGVDITHLAINLMKYRLKNMFNIVPNRNYKVVGEPEDLSGAVELAKNNRYQFQWWALSLINAKPYQEKKKGADTGIDGFIYFLDSPRREIKTVIVQVKSGTVGVKDIRDFSHVIDREKAQLGVFITLGKPTRAMIEEATTKGFYKSVVFNRDYPQIQIVTIEELLQQKYPLLPTNAIDLFKKAQEFNENQQLDALEDNRI